MLKKIFLLCAAFSLSFAFAGGVAYAKGSTAKSAPAKYKCVGKGKNRICYKVTTTINMDKARVDGELIGPGGKFFISKTQAHFNSLIALRSSFTKELLKVAKRM